MDTIYFVDFDHTISRRDVWDEIVKHSAPDQWKAIIKQYLSGELSSRECNLKLAKTVQPCEEDIKKRILEIGIDPTFHDFVKWIDKAGAEMMIVSDGYDYYIELLLKHESLDHLTYYSNKLVWTNEGIDVEFPYNQPDCERDMAHCKCQHITCRTGLRRVYIGDGISDTCGARKCEVIYAKRNLLDYCIEHNLPHTPFSDFWDIIEKEKQWFSQQTACTSS